MKAVILLLVAVVAAILLFPMLASPGITVPDVNSPTNANGVKAEGYADVTVHLFFLADTNPDRVVPGFEWAWANETLGTAQHAVTIAPPPATVTASCIIQMEMRPAGPQISQLIALSPIVQVSLPSHQLVEHIEFVFGHLYLYKGSQYTLSFTVQVSGCMSYSSPTTVKSFSETMTFDGVSEQFSGAGN